MFRYHERSGHVLCCIVLIKLRQKISLKVGLCRWPVDHLPIKLLNDGLQLSVFPSNGLHLRAQLTEHLHVLYVIFLQRLTKFFIFIHQLCHSITPCQLQLLVIFLLLFKFLLQIEHLQQFEVLHLVHEQIQF
ncbi:hypothetical protein TYRP_001661 [Tyrophagus putrescentiae]|nr:hypothetical protein TYRP_001661 [Tyrophagus putrescentiae]